MNKEKSNIHIYGHRRTELKKSFSLFFSFSSLWVSSQPSHLRRLYREKTSQGWPLRLIALRKQSPLDDYKCSSHSKGYNLPLFSTRLLLKHNLENKFILEFICSFLSILFIFSELLLVVGCLFTDPLTLRVKYFN